MRILSRAQSILLALLSSPPSTPVEGEIYYNSSTKMPMYHNGTSFQPLGSESAGASDELAMMNSMGGMY